MFGYCIAILMSDQPCKRTLPLFSWVHQHGFKTEELIWRQSTSCSTNCSGKGKGSQWALLPKD